MGVKGSKSHMAAVAAGMTSQQATNGSRPVSIENGTRLLSNPAGAFAPGFYNSSYDTNNNNTRYHTIATRTIMSGVPPKPPRQAHAEIGGSENVRDIQSQRMRTVKPVQYSTSYRVANNSSASSSNSHSSSPIARLSPIYHRRPAPGKQQNKSSLLQELIECPICFNLFDNPHVLPCQHTFCKACIDPLYKTIDKSLDCPICRMKHSLPNGIEGLTANFTIKRLIELESIESAARAEREKEKERAALASLNIKSSSGSGSTGSNSRAKCFCCQKYSRLRVCKECSYMLCEDCMANPDHDLIIESKINSRRLRHQPGHHAVSSTSSLITSTPKSKPIPAPPIYYSRDDRCEIYSRHKSNNRRSMSISSGSTYFPNFKLNLIVLCHSAAVEEKMLEQKKRKLKRMNKRNASHDDEADSSTDEEDSFGPLDDLDDEEDDLDEYEEDEFGNKCQTYTQLDIMSNDRIITLKKLIQKKFSLDMNDQILVYKDKIIRNDLRQLFACGITRQYSRVHVFDKRDIKSDQDEADLLSKANCYGIYQTCAAANKASIINSGADTEQTKQLQPTRPAPPPPSAQSTSSYRQTRKYSTMRPRLYDTHQSAAMSRDDDGMRTLNIRRDQMPPRAPLSASTERRGSMRSVGPSTSSHYTRLAAKPSLYSHYKKLSEVVLDENY